MRRAKRFIVEPRGVRARSVVRWSALRRRRVAVPGVRRHQARNHVQGPALRAGGAHQGQHRGENQVSLYHSLNIW